MVAIVTFCILIAVLFYATSSKKIEERGLVENVLPSPSFLPSQTSVPNNAVQVQEDNLAHATVRYEQGSFSPADITVTHETGCFVEVQNMSDADVVVRVGPYDAKQEKGFLYPPIAPHNSALIDPRHGVITQFSFYNKNNPDAQFKARIDPTCL